MSEFKKFWDQVKAGGLESVGVFTGIYRGVVTEVYAGDTEGRVALKVPRISPNVLPPARPLLPFCGPGFASHFGPKVDDCVIVMFEDGNPKLPWYVGGWAGTNDLPEDLVSGDAGFEVRGFVLRDGTKLLFREDGGTVEIVTPSGASATVGNESVSLSDGQGATATLQGGVATIQANTVKLAGEAQAAVLGNALREWLMTGFSLPSPLGPLGPIPVVPESFLSTKVKLG